MSRRCIDWDPESGETMKAAGLKAIDTVVESTATLIKSKHPSNQKLVDMIASRISGVISESRSPSFTTTELTISSCAKIHPLPIQHRSKKPGCSYKDHSRKAGTNRYGFGRSRMGGYQLNGTERDHSIGHGRADSLWCY